jgi:hypothetical protein
VATSQNGWTVSPPRTSRLVPGTTDVRVTVADGPAGDVLIYVLAQVHARVESLELDGTRGELDDWGYAERPIIGGTATSNHASATAVDANATRHPLAATGTFTAAQVHEIHAILAEVDNVVRWGGDYTGRKDEMHFEINANQQAVAAVAARLQEDDMSGEGENILATVLTGGESTRAITFDDKTGQVMLPTGVDPSSLLGRLADVQWAMTRQLPRILEELAKLRTEVAELRDRQ